jgi:uncharacterized protein (TIGR02246 family)
MKAFAALFGTAVVLFSMAGCNAPAPPAPPDTHDADVKAISDLEAKQVADFAARNLDGIVAIYADDAVLMSPGGPPSKGKDAIRNGLKEMIADPAMSLKFKADKVEVSKTGDIGYTQGTYTMTVTNPATHKPLEDHGSYVTTYRKQADGTWKAVADIATSEVPPMPPPKKK